MNYFGIIPLDITRLVLLSLPNTIDIKNLCLIVSLETYQDTNLWTLKAKKVGLGDIMVKSTLENYIHLRNSAIKSDELITGVGKIVIKFSDVSYKSIFHDIPYFDKDNFEKGVDFGAGGIHIYPNGPINGRRYTISFNTETHIFSVNMELTHFKRLMCKIFYFDIPRWIS